VVPFQDGLGKAVLAKLKFAVVQAMARFYTAWQVHSAGGAAGSDRRRLVIRQEAHALHVLPAKAVL
jgi:hypothetical protein